MIYCVLLRRKEKVHHQSLMTSISSSPFYIWNFYRLGGLSLPSGPNYSSPSEHFSLYPLVHVESNPEYHWNLIGMAWIMCYVPTLVGDQFWKIITKNVVNYKIPKFDWSILHFCSGMNSKVSLCLIIKSRKSDGHFYQLRLTNRVNTFSGASFASS